VGKPHGWYLAGEVGQLAGVSGEKVGQWARRGLIRSSLSTDVPRVYSFEDVAESMVVHELLDLGVPHADIRAGIQALRSKFGDWPLQSAPIAAAHTASRKPTLVLDRPGGAWEIGRRRGQGVFAYVDLEAVRGVLRRGGWAIRQLPRVESIEVDPERLSGRPSIRDRRVPAAKIARLSIAGRDVKTLHTEYGVTRREVEDAVAWYRAISAYQEEAA